MTSKFTFGSRCSKMMDNTYSDTSNTGGECVADAQVAPSNPVSRHPTGGDRSSSFNVHFKRAEHILVLLKRQLETMSPPCTSAMQLMDAAWYHLQQANQLSRRCDAGDVTDVTGVGKYGHVQDSMTRREFEIAYEQLCQAMAMVRKNCFFSLGPGASRYAKIVHHCATLTQVLFVACMVGIASWGAWAHLSRPGEKEGLFVTHFASADFRGHPFMWTDHRLAFNWITSPPIKLLNQKTFSTRWQGCLYVPTTQLSLSAETTESALSVWIDGQSVIELSAKPAAVVHRSPGRYSGYISGVSQSLSPGVHPIEVRSPTNSVPVQIRLRWRRSDGKYIPISHDSLIVPGGNSAHNCPDMADFFKASDLTATSERKK